MKPTNPHSNNANDLLRHACGGCQALALVVLMGAGWNLASCKAETLPATVPAAQDAQGVQVLTRGPVHEAFAGTVLFNPEPGIIVAKAPPEPIEEIPPSERPAGDNVTWIPGYWAWDEEADNFLWVSGTWRALPPGRQWVAGYWLQITQGYQWTSGYWADAAAQETVYLAAPPATVETGPNVAAPSADHRWTPGNWIWNQNRYAWGAGYWARGRADWDWTPSHYVWTPRGYIFVDGYWDYPVARRGALFAPVYFESGVYARSGYSYSPSILIDLAVFAEHLFLRPRYSHYYFGDYYAPSYQQGGYYSAFAFQSSRYGYDPIYAHQRWEHRQDQGWNARMETSYQYRRDNENARPPRTWSAQRALADSPEFAKHRMSVGAPLDQMAKRKDGGTRFQAVTQNERQALAQRGKEVGSFREQRRTQEATGAPSSASKAGELTAPTRVKQARSPIVAKSTKQLGKGSSPPAVQRAPKSDAKDQPAPRNKQAQPAARDKQAQTKPRDKQAQPAARDKQAQPAARDKQAQPAARDKQAQPAARDKQAQPKPRDKQAQPKPRDKQAQPAAHAPTAKTPSPTKPDNEKDGGKKSKK